MSRAVWFVAGAGAGIYGVLRARRVAEAFTVDGLRDRVGAAAVGARMFRDEVAQGKAEAEFHLRDRLAERAAQIEGSRPPELTDHRMHDLTQIEEGSTH